MPATIPTQFKLTEAERARLDELGKLWGTPERPLSWAAVHRRAVSMAHTAELVRQEAESRKREPKPARTK